MQWDTDLIVSFGGIALIVFVVSFFRFLRAKMRHKEVLAAIEKGVAVPDLSDAKPRIPRGITNIALGIALIVLSLAFTLHGLAACRIQGMEEVAPTLIWGSAYPSLVCFSIGLFCLVRGWMIRKHEKENQPSKPSEAEQNRSRL